MPSSNLKSKSLMEETQRLLAADNRSISVISIEAKIPEQWLYRFSRIDPAKNGANTNTVQRLYEFLTQKPLLPS